MNKTLFWKTGARYGAETLIRDDLENYSYNTFSNKNICRRKGKLLRKLSGAGSEFSQRTTWKLLMKNKITFLPYYMPQIFCVGFFWLMEFISMKELYRHLSLCFGLVKIYQIYVMSALPS